MICKYFITVYLLGVMLYKLLFFVYPVQHLVSHVLGDGVLWESVSTAADTLDY